MVTFQFVILRLWQGRQPFEQQTHFDIENQYDTRAIQVGEKSLNGFSTLATERHLQQWNYWNLF